MGLDLSACFYAGRPQAASIVGIAAAEMAGLIRSENTCAKRSRLDALDWIASGSVSEMMVLAECPCRDDSNFTQDI